MSLGLTHDHVSSENFCFMRELMQREAAIVVEPGKEYLIETRLAPIATERHFESVNDFIDHLRRCAAGDPIRTEAISALTTNETYFFREPQHFEHLKRVLAERRTAGASGDFRVWSAASSSGEEAYSIAMVLGEHFGLRGWQIIGTDLSTTMVDVARRGLYPLERARLTPTPLLKRWCLKGQGDNTGKLMVIQELRQHVQFECANLTRTLPEIGQFDIIFLRNVLIYFDAETKRAVIDRVVATIKPGGILFMGTAEGRAHAESGLESLVPGAFRKPVRR